MAPSSAYLVSWDTHHNHYGRLKEFLLPVFYHTFSTLILDLQRRCRVDSTGITGRRFSFQKPAACEKGQVQIT